MGAREKVILLAFLLPFIQALEEPYTLGTRTYALMRRPSLAIYVASIICISSDNAVILSLCTAYECSFDYPLNQFHIKCTGHDDPIRSIENRLDRRSHVRNRGNKRASAGMYNTQPRVNVYYTTTCVAT